MKKHKWVMISGIAVISMILLYVFMFPAIEKRDEPKNPSPHADSRILISDEVHYRTPD